jgi:hypothetical protein
MHGQRPRCPRKGKMQLTGGRAGEDCGQGTFIKGTDRHKEGRCSEADGALKTSTGSV